MELLDESYSTKIYDHNSQKDFWSMFKSNKKTLVVTKVKISVGYDFSKIRFRKENNERKLIFKEFAPYEILSSNTDYKFYDTNQGITNKFNCNCCATTLTQAKKTMLKRWQESDLPQIAANQVELRINQLAASMNWEVDLIAISGTIQKNIESKN